MTPHTEAERAEFEAWARGYGTWEVKRDDDVALGTTGYTDITLTVAWHAVQAARRAPEAPVPQGYDSGVQTGNRVTLAFDTQSNATAWFEKFCDDYDAAAGTKTIKLPISADAAPQPPEAAPVQLPEPLGVVVTTIGNYASVNAAPFVRKGDKLYTEQQVRELLANHGIQERST